jgi:hypothetical protein
VGAIHGRILTAWSVAGVLGPVLVNYLNEAQVRAGFPRARAYDQTMLALAVGFALLLLIDYGLFLASGQLPTAFDPLTSVIAIQFVPLLAIIAAIGTFTWRRTGSAVPGGLVCGLFVTWYVVAGTATQVM